MEGKQRRKFSIAAACFTYQSEYEKVNTKLLKELFDEVLKDDWIKLEDEEPADKQDCIIYIKDKEVSVDIWYDGGWVNEGSSVTQWMPLPDPPRKPQNNG